MTTRVSPNNAACGPFEARRLSDFVDSLPRPAAAFVVTEVAGSYVATGIHNLGPGALLTVVNALLSDMLNTPARCACPDCANRVLRARRAHSALKFGMIEGGLH